MKWFEYWDARLMALYSMEKTDDKYIKLVIRNITKKILQSNNLDEFFIEFARISRIIRLWYNKDMSPLDITNLITPENINRIKIHLSKLPNNNSFAENLLDWKIITWNKNSLFSDIQVVNPHKVDVKYFEYLNPKDKAQMQLKISQNCDLVVFMDNLNDIFKLGENVIWYACVPFRIIFVGTKTTTNRRDFAPWYIWVTINHELDHIIDDEQYTTCIYPGKTQETKVRAKEKEYIKKLLENPDITPKYKKQMIEQLQNPNRY